MEPDKNNVVANKVNTKIKFFSDWLNRYFGTPKKNFVDAMTGYGISALTAYKLMSGSMTDYKYETIAIISEIANCPIDEMFDIEPTPQGNYFEDRWSLAMLMYFVDKDNSLYDQINLASEKQIFLDSINNDNTQHTVHGLARKVEAIRKANGISLKQLSETISCSPSLLTAKRMNSHSIRMGKLLRLSISLNSSIDFLVGSKKRIQISPKVDPYYWRLLELSDPEIHRLARIVYDRLPTQKEFERAYRVFRLMEPIDSEGRERDG